MQTLKPSEMLKECLKSYTAEHFMCNILESKFYAEPRFRETSETFMPIIRQSGWSTLANYLRKVDKGYKLCVDASQRQGGHGHSSQAAHKRRVAWWNNHIAWLESNGM